MGSREERKPTDPPERSGAWLVPRFPELPPVDNPKKGGCFNLMSAFFIVMLTLWQLFTFILGN